MENNQLAKSNGIVRTMDDVIRTAEMMAKSGYFTDSRDAAQCCVKIMAGMEMGFGAFASMTGIHIIAGKPTVGANLMAAAIKSSGKYNYKVNEMSEKVCKITFYENGEEIGVSEFTIEDAKKAQVKNLDKFARNMLFARAISNGVKWYTPDIFQAPIYTPEELGAIVNDEGDIIDLPPEPKQEPEQKTKPVEKKPFDEEKFLRSFNAQTGFEPLPLEEAEAELSSKEGAYGDMTTEQLFHRMVAILKRIHDRALTADETPVILHKLAAIQTILLDRKSKL